MGLGRVSCCGTYLHASDRSAARGTVPTGPRARAAADRPSRRRRASGTTRPVRPPAVGPLPSSRAGAVGGGAGVSCRWRGVRWAGGGLALRVGSGVGVAARTSGGDGRDGRHRGAARAVLEEIAAAGDEAALEAVRLAALGKKGEVSALMRGLGAHGAGGAAGGGAGAERAEGRSGGGARRGAGAAAGRWRWKARVAGRVGGRDARRARPAAAGERASDQPGHRGDRGDLRRFGVLRGGGAAGRERLVQLRRPDIRRSIRRGRTTTRSTWRGRADNRPPHVLRHPHLAGADPAYGGAGAPCRIIAPRRHYRADYDQTHTPMFHQVEGLASTATCRWRT